VFTAGADVLGIFLCRKALNFETTYFPDASRKGDFVDKKGVINGVCYGVPWEEYN
jgi:hypothetical protein